MTEVEIITWERRVLGDPGVWGLEIFDGGVMGPGNLSPSVFLEAGEPLGC